MADPFALEIAKMTIPVATFVLGSVLTIALKQYELRREVRQGSVKEVVRLTKDWYTQIQQLAVSALSTWTDTPFERSVYDYISNRLLLPDVLLHVEILKKQPQCAPLVSEVEGFLKELTNYDSGAGGRDMTRCDQLFQSGFRPDEFLARLDVRLQRVVREAARLMG
jgi:hypothetical protein